MIEAVDVPFSYAVVLFADYEGGPPDGDDAETYAESLGYPSYPVVADPEVGILDSTLYDGNPLPGKCALSPDMEILGCENGHGEDDWARLLIEAHRDR